MSGFAHRAEVVVLAENSLQALLRSLAARLELGSGEPPAQLDSARFVTSRNDAVVPDFAEP